MRRIIAASLVFSTVLIGGVAHAAVADLQLRGIQRSVTTAEAGDRVVFRAFGKNLGPGKSQVDVSYTGLRNLADEPVLQEHCVIPETQGGGEFNADTPSCEFGEQPKGFVGVAKVVTHVEGTPGEYASITFCTFNEMVGDDDPANDCKTARILITA